MTDTSHGGDGPSDLDLIDRWRRGDERAAAALVARHAPALSRFAAASGAGADAAEVVQDTFVRAFGALDTFRGGSSLRTWLFTIARRLLLDRRRARGRRELVEVHDDDLATEHDALDGVVAAETARRLRCAVDRLTPTQREVFVLRVSEGLSYREIAETVGTTEGAARVHYHNALRSVKEYLDA
jgi:RNA polymerase sigma-70 factor, ECF subfamily